MSKSIIAIGLKVYHNVKLVKVHPIKISSTLSQIFFLSMCNISPKLELVRPPNFDRG